MVSTSSHRSRKGGISAGVFAALLAVCAASFWHSSAWAAQPVMLPIAGGGLKITVNFADQQQSKLVFVGTIPAMTGVNLMNQNVSVNVGGIQRAYVLSPDGEGTATPDLFQLRDLGTGYAVILSTLDNSLANAFKSYGFVNTDSSNAAVSMPVSINFQGVMYGVTLTGIYDAQANTVGKGFLGIVLPPKDPFATITHVATLMATPNPTKANQAVTIKGDVSLKNFTGTVAGSLHFGDMTAPVIADGTTFQSMLKAGISHTYTADGVYVARLALAGGDEIADTRLFVIVGDGYVVNSQNGAVGRLVKTPGGGVTLQVGVGNVPGAMNAQTNFMDMRGNTAGMPPAPPPPGGQVGLQPSNTFTLPGVYVAESMALDQGGNALGMLRKTIVISSTDLGKSATYAADGTEVITPRDTTTTADSTITLSSMSGSFLFTSSANDKVVFTGTITLPKGFTPGNSTGNDITIALGNVSDTVHLNSKNKFVSPSTLGYISKFALTVPKLTGGVAAGTETAKLSLTMSVGDLDVKGFDSEGVSVSLRSDEAGQTSVARFIQADMLLGGKSYSSLIQVSYSVTSNADFGTISGRASK